MENPTLGFGPINVGKSEICRLCMKTHAYYLNIFVSYEEFTMSIGKAIEDLLVLKVAKDDNLPKMVCCPCVTKLMELREFKEMCMNFAREFGRHAPVEPITTFTKDVFPRGSSGESDDCGEEDFAESECDEDAAVCSDSIQLLMGDQGEVKEELESTEYVGNVESQSREIIDEDNSSDTGGPILLSDILVVMGMTDKKEVYLRDPLAECDDSGEEDLAGTNYNEDAAAYSDSIQLLIREQGEVKKELESTELVGNVEIHSREVIDEGDSSDTGGPIPLSDIVPVTGMVDRCNNNGRLTEELEKEFDKFGADRQGISKDKLLNDPSFDPECEENLQLEYSMANHFVADCFPEKMVKKQKKNVIFCTSSNEFSQVNDRASPVRNHECEKFCHQSENTSYPTHYICYYCSKRYSQKNSLARHIKRHVDGKKSAIVLPKKEFPPRFSQYLLEKDRGNVEPVILETSNMSCTLKSSRRKNEKPAVEESSRGEHLGRELCSSRTLFIKSVNLQDKAAFVCDTCGIEFLKKCQLAKHVNVPTGLVPSRYQQKGKVTLTYFKPLRCDLCGKYFKNTKTLKRHSVTHTGVKPFKCNECGKTFTISGSLKAHSVVHTGVKKFKCNECGKMFAHSSNLNKHSVLHNGVKAFKCNECGKMFARKSHLKTHLLVHTGVRPFKCNECGKMFSQSSSLKTHSVVHTGVKKFKCDECGKMFARSSNLKMHSVVHKGVKKFKCNECGKMFTQSGHLKSHLVVHTGVKPFKCNECGKMFTQSSHLKSHLVIHTGVKPFKCNECGKMFTQSASLKAHSRIHSGVMPFKCDICGKKFKWRVSLKSHLHTHADRIPSK